MSEIFPANTSPALANSLWVSDTNTWVYASATSFTIAGVDVTSQFTKGTRISYNDGGVDYGTVASSSFSTNTTVNLIPNNEYSIANATLTAPRYSYAVNPTGYPTWFSYTPTLVGFSADPTNTLYRFRVEGSALFLYVRQATNGTSNATNFTVSLPVNTVTLVNSSFQVLGSGVDNTALIAGGVLVTAGSAVSAITLFTNAALAVWTNSGGKRASFQIWYEF